MKIKSYEYVAAIFMAMLTVLCGQNLAYGIDVADRTPQVRDAIVVAAGVETPEEVTEAHLSAITSLSLGLSNITSLTTGDFEGLTSLEVLLLNNNPLTDLPETVFSGLTSLQVLLLNNNPLTDLPETVFNDLSSLQVLLLNNNPLTDLPETVFNDLSSLQVLLLNNNQLMNLPETVFRGLTSLIVLRLNNNQLTDLPETVFSSLRALQYLDLDSNQLTFLPDGIFTGLTSLQSLYLGNNAVDPVDLMVSLEKVANGQFKAVAPTGAPFDVVLPIRITNGSILGGATALTIPQGHLESKTFTVTRTPGTLTAVTAEIETLPGLPAGHSGYALVKSGELPIELIGSQGINPISGRTPQVQNAIAVAAGVASPEEVTEVHLSTITSLDLTSSNIVSLKACDFEGLTALQHLDLSTNPFTFLPVGVFSGLTSLQHLNLSHNPLILLPAGIFGGLAALEELLLNNNQLTALPETVFSGLVSLQRLDLDSNRLTSLPDSVFNGLTALQQLNLGNNAVDPIALTVSLERVADGQFKAVAPIGAPFDVMLPIRITNGRIGGGATALTIRQGQVESEILTVTQTFEVLTTVTADIETLPDLPVDHSGYAFRAI